jgi:hypothetical protein
MKLGSPRGITNHTGDVVTRSRKFFRQLPADVAGRTSHQDLHAVPLFRRQIPKFR